MKKIVRFLKEYNIKNCIDKLRHLSKERIFLNRQLDELTHEYIGLEKAKINIELKPFCKQSDNFQYYIYRLFIYIDGGQAYKIIIKDIYLCHIKWIEIHSATFKGEWRTLIMKLENKNVTEVSRVYSIIIALCVAACVLTLVGIKILVTTRQLRYTLKKRGDKLNETPETLHNQKLENCIDTLRDTLNEMCCLIDEREVNIDKLNVSRQLDTLIVEYMEIKK